MSIKKQSGLPIADCSYQFKSSRITIIQMSDVVVMLASGNISKTRKFNLIIDAPLSSTITG
jgi:hypothetical protein